MPAYCTLQPSCVRPSTRSPMGRSCMRGTPRSTKWPSSIARTAVNGRMAVPAFPRNRSVGDCGCLQLSGKQAAMPSICTVVPDCSTRQPICCSAINMTRVSSESSTPCSVVPPLHKPASSSTRLLMLLEPGNCTDPCADCNGGISRYAGRLGFMARDQSMAIPANCRGTVASSFYRPAPATHLRVSLTTDIGSCS